MSSSRYQTVFVPVDLGEASRFNRTIFPLSYRKRDTIGRSDLYLDATLDEMLKIIHIGTNLQQHWEELVSTTKDRYDLLILKKQELEQRPKSKNPFKIYANYRATRMFLSASKKLYHDTRSRSEEIMRSVGRSLLSVPSEEVEPANNNLPPDAAIDGIAVRLDRLLDDTTMQQIVDATNTMTSYHGPYPDDQVNSESTFLTDDYILASESLSSFVNPDDNNLTIPPSPTIIQNYYTNFIYSSNSNVHGATLQLCGTQNGC